MDTYACMCAQPRAHLQPPLHPLGASLEGPLPDQGLAPSLGSTWPGRAGDPASLPASPRPPRLRRRALCGTNGHAPGGSGPAPSTRSPPQPPTVGRGSPTPTSLPGQARPALGTCQGPGPYPLRMPWTWGTEPGEGARALAERRAQGGCVPQDPRPGPTRLAQTLTLQTTPWC